MVLQCIMLVFIVNQMVMIQGESELFKELINTYPKAQGNKLLPDCSNTSIVEISKIQDGNEKDVLCTLYLHKLLDFIQALNNKLQQNWNESILFSPDINNSSICDKPDFLTSNGTMTNKVICLKLCTEWNGTVNQKCSLAYYYYNFNASYAMNRINKVTVTPVTKEYIPSTTVQAKAELNSKKDSNIAPSVNENSLNPSTQNHSAVDVNDKNTNSSEIRTNGTLGSMTVSELTVPTEKIQTAENEDIADEQIELNESYENQPQSNPEKDSSKGEKSNVLVEDISVSRITAEVDGESYFFSYFMLVCILFVMGYIFYHNRAKVMALVLEGKRNRRQSRSRRPDSANYHKLDSNLEEALTSSCNKNLNQIIY